MKTITPQIRRADSATPTEMWAGCPHPANPRAHPSPAAPGPTLSAPPSIDLQIEALVFHGFTRAESHRATAALHQELTHLITTEGLPAAAQLETQNPNLETAAIRASAARPELTGLRAARALHEGLRA